MKAVGIAILRDALDGGDLLNALRKGLRVCREDQNQPGTELGEVVVATHGTTSGPGLRFCLPGYQTLVYHLPKRLDMSFTLHPIARRQPRRCPGSRVF